MTKRKYNNVMTKENFQIVEMAIEELQNNNEKITIPKIAKLTDICVSNLYRFPNLKSYINKHTKPKLTLVPPSNQAIDLVYLENTVASYSKYIKENFFSKSEYFDEVIAEVKATIANYDETAFIQAVNLFIVNGELEQLASADNKARYMFKAEPKPEPKYSTNSNYLIAISENDNTTHKDVPGTDMSEEYVKGLLWKQPQATLTIYKLVETVSCKFQIEVKNYN